MRYLLLVSLVVLAFSLPSSAADEKKVWQDWSEMRSAARFCDKEKMRKLLAGGANIESVNPMTGQTLLMDAAAGNNPDAVKFLLSFGADINAKDKYGQTALSHSLASVSRGWTAAKVLFDAGAEINTVSSQGRTELTAAVINQNVDGVNFLVSCYKKKKVKRADDRNETILQALFHYNPKIFKIVAEWDIADSKDPKAAATAILWKTIEYKDAAPAVKWLVSRGADAGAGMLIPACRNGNVAAAKALVKAGADVNARDPEGKTALICTVEGGDDDLKRQKLEIVNGLVKAGADINAQDKEGKTALMYAASWSLPILKSLLLSGAKVNLTDGDGHTALFHAAMESAEMLKLLLAAGADPKAKSKDAKTVLHWAAYGGKTDVLKMLLALNIDVNAADENGETPLMLAAREQRYEALRLLIEAGADLRVRDKNGATPLISAAKEIRTADIIKILTSSGVDVNAVDNAGRTALMEAAAMRTTQLSRTSESWRPAGIRDVYDNSEALKAIIIAGADVNAADKEGRTALDYAAGDEEIIKILKDAGALSGRKINSKKD